MKRPAETTTLGAAVLAAVVSGVGLDGAGVDTTTWLTAAVGIVPFGVSALVDFFRERKEERELRAELSERVVIAVETLASIELPESQTGEEEEEGSAASGDDKASILDDFLVLLDRARMPQTPDKAKKEGDGSGGEGDRAGPPAERNKRPPARKPPPRAHA